MTEVPQFKYSGDGIIHCKLNLTGEWALHAHNTKVNQDANTWSSNNTTWPSLFVFFLICVWPFAQSHYDYVKGSRRECGIRSLPKASTDGCRWDSNRTPLDPTSSSWWWWLKSQLHCTICVSVGYACDQTFYAEVIISVTYARVRTSKAVRRYYYPVAWKHQLGLTLCLYVNNGVWILHTILLSRFVFQIIVIWSSFFRFP